MTASRSASPLGWLAVLGLALVASSALLRRERPAPCPPADADDFFARIYA